MSRATEKANPAVLMVLSSQKIKNVDLLRDTTQWGLLAFATLKFWRWVKTP